MSAKKQSRKWNLTINHPIEKGWTHEKLKTTLQGIASLTYYCMADEKGENEVFHTHIYIVSKNPKPFTTMKNFFPESHIEAPDGTSRQNRDYIFKEGEKFNKNPDTGEYDYTDTSGKKHKGTHYDSSHEEYGELPDERQGQRTDLSQLYEMIKDGYSDVDIMEQNPKYLMHLDKIERARQAYRFSIYSDVWRTMDVTYIWGTTGSGKTRYVVDKYGYSNVYRVTDYLHPFDSYKGQDVILFEEFRSSLKMDDMLKFLDGHPVEIPARYMNRVACYTKVYFCTNIDLRDQYRHIQEDEPETWRAFLRRIHTVRVMFDGRTASFPTEVYLNGEWFFLTDEQEKSVPFYPDYEQIEMEV